MPCFRPLTGYRGPVGESGKASIVFSKREAKSNEVLELPCGRCNGCKMERSRQWAVRCVHESSLYEDNCFVTLTYNDENLPEGGTLVKSDVQKFLKRLRKNYPARKIRYFMCGEYGEKLSRPHYHLILFNLDFADKKFWRMSNSGHRIYTSKELEAIWGKGYCEIGSVTFGSAVYVAQYTLKKVTGKAAKKHYNGKLPEYLAMSRGGSRKGSGGIGKGWFEKYGGQTYNDDSVVISGREVKPPKFYDKLMEGIHPERLEEIKDARKKKATKKVVRRFKKWKVLCEDSDYGRLAVKERVFEARIKHKKRELKNENGSVQCV